MASKKRIRTDLLQERYTVRLDRATHLWVEEQAKNGHYKSGQDFIRELVKKERSGKNSAFEGLEDSILATLNAQTRELEQTQATSYASFAAVMGLANLFLQTHMPPTREAKQVIDANHRRRLDAFLKEVGIGMKGPWADALQDLAAENGEDE
jgi:Arc/MetJ-type ribon-helix-helix transcriptional regulator